jgi:hypothetical protein
MSVSLSMVFTGLCAFVGNGDGSPAEILLLDARGVGQVRGVTLPEHAPTLVVSLNELANPDSSAPTRVVAGRAGPTGRVDQVGLWDLTGSEIRIRVQGGEGQGLRFFQPAKYETSWPEPPRDPNDPAAWRDLRFIPHMMDLVGDGRIDPALLGNGDTTPTGLPRSIAARIHLDAGLLEGGLPSQETYREETFEFRRSGSDGILRQALTDTVQWTLQTGASAVAIDIIPLGGGPSKRLLLATSAEPHRLQVSNLPVENPSHADAHQAMSDDEMVAFHFGAYYSLLLNDPPARPLPELWRPLGGQMGSGGLRPQSCGPAMFSRP